MTSYTYRVERQEKRAKHPFHDQWVQDQWTTMQTYDTLRPALAIAQNPGGPFAHHPFRVVEMVTTENVVYEA